MIVVARLKAVDGKEAEVEAVLSGLIPEVKKEPGTLVYTLHKKQNDPTVFLFYEKYKDVEALMAHSATHNFKKAFEIMAPLLAEKPDIQLYDEIGAI